MNEVVAFGFAVAEFFRDLHARSCNDRPILAHFHEWMGGVAVPRIAHLKLPVATVFTTHATLLGPLPGQRQPLLLRPPAVPRPRRARRRKYNIYPRFAIERAAAHASTVFTTVSEVTAHRGREAARPQPEAILPNGLNIQRFAALHEFQNLHREYKERIHEFVMGHFFPSYTFDLDNTIYFFTAGRYEYRNKGMDMFIEALCAAEPAAQGGTRADPTDGRRVHHHPRADAATSTSSVLQNQTMFDDLRAHLQRASRSRWASNLFHAAAHGRLPTYAELLPDDAQVRLEARDARLADRPPAADRHPRPGGRRRATRCSSTCATAGCSTPPTTR